MTWRTVPSTRILHRSPEAVRALLEDAAEVCEALAAVDGLRIKLDWPDSERTLVDLIAELRGATQDVR